ncbi:hypothetical protein GCM10020255_039540 [Rhodococcus baikonurensis]
MYRTTRTNPRERAPDASSEELDQAQQSSAPSTQYRRSACRSGGAAKPGCELPVPTIPAGREWSDNEKTRWTELWESPQATQWDETATGTVALLVAYESMLLKGEGTAWIAQEARHASDALGLTPKAMAALGWAVEQSGGSHE